MKTRLNRSGPGQRPFVINTVILLLVNCFVLSQSVPSTPDLHNWLSVSKDNWPQVDPLDEQDKGKPFYVFHSQSVESTLFSSKKDLFDKVDLVSNPDLLFKYWTTEGSGSLRARSNPSDPKPTREIKLEKTKQWVDGALNDIKLADWKTLNFLNLFDITLALKDVKVKYIEKIQDGTKEKSPIHSFKDTGDKKSENIEKFNFTKDTEAKGGLFAGPSVVIEFPKPTLKVEFQYKTTNALKAAATIESDTGCKIKVEDSKFTTRIACGDQNKINKITISAKDGAAIAVWDLKDNEGKPINDATSKQAITIATGSADNVYNVLKADSENTVSFVNLDKQSQKLGSDVCYSIQKGASTPAIDFYLTFLGANNGVKLQTVTDPTITNPICLKNFVAVQNLKDYQVTLVVRGRIESDFQFSVQSESSKDIHKPERADPSSEEWFYYNPLFDYNIKSDDVEANFRANLALCDVVANCFPYVQTKGTKNGKRSVSYSLRSEYKKILASSPFVRIAKSNVVNEGEIEKLEFVDNANVKGVELLKEKLLAANTNLKDKITVDATGSALTISPNFDSPTDEQNTKQTTITLPLDTLDYRTQRLVIEVAVTSKAADDKDAVLSLSQITYKSSEQDGELTFPDSPNPGYSMKLDAVKISSDDFFLVPATQTSVAGRLVRFVLNLKESKTGKVPDVAIRLTVADLPEDVKAISSAADLAKVKDNVKYTFDQGTEIKAGKNRLLFSSWINAGQNKNLGDTGLSFKLTITTTKTIEASKLLTNILIYRVVFTQNNPLAPVLVSTAASLKHVADAAKKEYEFTDAINDADGAKSYALKGPYRIGYFIHFAHADNTAVLKFTIDNFVVKSPTEDPAKCGEFSLINDCQYENPLCPREFDDCKFNTFYQASEQTCDQASGCANIFDTSFLVSTTYAAETGVAKYLPYQLRITDSPSSHNLMIKIDRPEANKNGDFCVTFDYFAKDSPLAIAANATQNFNIQFPQTNKLVSGQRVCASWLSNDVATIQALYFVFTRPALIDIDNNYVTNINQELSANVDKPDYVLSDGIYWDQAARKQFASNQIGTNWDILTQNTLQFKIDNIEDFKKDLKGNTTVSFLRTKWLAVPTTEKIKLSLKLSGQNKTNTDVYKLSVEINSPEENLLRKTISELSSEKLNTFTVPDSVKFYQVTFKLALDLSNIKFGSGDKQEWKVFELALESLTVNDACVDDSDKLIDCHGHGTCRRYYGNSTRDCKCLDGYEQFDDCKTTDYCKRTFPENNGVKLHGTVECNKLKLKCKNNPEFDNYKCECPENTRWDPLSLRCLPNELNCQENQEYGFDPQTQLPGCLCKEDYEKTKDKDGKEVCTAKDPCKNKVCSDKNAKCVPTADKKSFTCACNAGFLNKNGKKPGTTSVTCVHQKCQIESVCDQICEPKADGSYECKCNTNYDLDNGKCKAKKPTEETEKKLKCQSSGSPAPFVQGSGCACTDGYWWNATGTSCQLKTEHGSFFAEKLGCKKGVTLRDGKPSCECDADTEVYDSESRSCVDKKECSEKEKSDCLTKHKAQCEWANKKATCTCSAKEIKFNTNENDKKAKPEDRAWNCVNRCDILKLQDRKDYSCSGAFQQCVADKVAVGTLEDNEIFIWNSTTAYSIITSNNDPTNNGHCKCLSGFHPDGDKCVQNDDPQVSISMDFSTDKDPKVITGYFRELIKSIIIPSNEATSRINGGTSGCTRQNGTTTSVQCRASFASTQNSSAIQALLHDACIPIDKTNTKCVYFVKVDLSTLPAPGGAAGGVDNFVLVSSQSLVGGGVSTPNVKLTNVLVREMKDDTVKVNEDNLCKVDDPCKTFANSVCSRVDDTHLIKCECDKNFYSVVGTNTFNSKNSKVKFETCKVRNLCEEEPKTYGCQSDATCHFKVEFNEAKNQYTGSSFCTCQTTTLPNREVSCKQTCDGKGQCTANADKCAINMYDPSKFVCHCKEGYTGELCEKKVESETTSKAYLISTIVVSIIAVIALIGLAVLYFRRR